MHAGRSAISAILLIILLPGTSSAMHISEGILPFSWALFWYAVSAPFLAWGLRTLTQRSAADLGSKPLTGMIAAVVFIISCMPIPIPVAGTCSHPCGTGLAAILLGPALGIVVAAVALLIQALFMAHGGLTTYGANLCAMGVAGSLAGYAVFRVTRTCGGGIVLAAFLGGVAADWATYSVTAMILAIGISGSQPVMPLFLTIITAFIPTQLPLGIMEGAIGAGLIRYIQGRRPELLDMLRKGAAQR